MKKTVTLFVVGFFCTANLLWSSCSGQVKEKDKINKSNIQTKK